MSEENHEGVAGDLSELEFLRLLARDRQALARLRAGERLRVATPFRFPGRYGPVVIHLEPAVGDAAEGRSGAVKISDGGDLLKSLDEQGMDLAIDMILSKTVFHAIKEVDGAGLANGQVFIDSSVDHVSADIWRFVQLITEIIGLRHSKYKDALVRLSRRNDGPDLIDWTEH